jgi:WD40 repeat protein
LETQGANTGDADDAVEVAERAYTAMDEADRLVARGLLLRLVPFGGGAEDAGRRLPLIDLEDVDQAGALARVLDALVRARLVAVDGAEITLADQALADTWPRLRTWIEQEQSVLAAAHQAIDAAHAWKRNGCPDASLFRGAQLEAALKAERDGGGDLLGPTARQFLNSSLEQQRVRRRWLRRRRMALVGALALAAGTISAVSMAHRHESARNAALRSQRLIASAKALTSDPGLAIQLAVAAYRASPSPQATELLYSMLDQPADRVIDATGSGILRVAVQQKGSLAAAVSEDGSLRIWSLDNPTAPDLQATIHTQPVAIALAPRSRVLAGPCAKPALCLWNLADPRHPTVSSRLPLPAHLPKAGITRMAISPDGTLLAAATASGHTLLWSIAQPEQPRLLHDFMTPAGGPANDHLAAVTFAPRGNLLAITIQRYGDAGEAGHGATELWNITDAAHPSSVATIAAGYQSVAFSPDGSLLAAAGGTKVVLWKLDQTGHPAPINAQPVCAKNPAGGIMDIQTIAFSPDGGQLAYSGEDSLKGNTHGGLCILNVSPVSLYSGSPVATSLPTGFGTSDLAYTPDGALFTGGHDGVARLWRSPLPQIGGLSTSDSTSWDISPNGRLLVAPIAPPGLLDTSSFGIWDISSSSAPVLDAVVRVPTRMVSFLNARALVTVAQGGAVRLWNLTDPHHPAPAASLGTTLPVALGGYSAVVNSDTAGDLVAVLDFRSRLHLWRITRAPGAEEVGSLPATGASTGPAGILADGRTALLITSTGIKWWNIADPAHPVPGGTSPLSGGLGMGDGAGSLMAVANAPGSTGSGATLRLFDVDKGRPKAAVTLSTSVASQLELTRDGRLLAATGHDNNALMLWDIADPQHPRRRTVLAVPHIQGIAFASTDRLMADWNDTTVQPWDIHNPAAPVLRASLTLPSQATSADQRVTGARFSPSAATLLVATNDSVFFYDADPAALANRLCSFAGRPISRAQ